MQDSNAYKKRNEAGTGFFQLSILETHDSAGTNQIGNILFNFDQEVAIAPAPLNPLSLGP